MTTSAETWTIQRILQWSVGYLKDRQLGDSPRLDAELLLAHCLGVNRVYLYTHFDRVLSPAEREPFKDLLRRRGAGEPIAYIIGTKEFLGHTFQVSPAVLIPRPDTEIVVETALAEARDLAASRPARPLRVLDVGTGSGCIAISLALALPEARVTAWDVEAGALGLARDNAQRLGAGAAVHFERRDALASEAWQVAEAATAGGGPAEGLFDLIVSNPPYISAAERPTLARSVAAFEPALALFAPEDGLAFYRVFAARAMDRLVPGGRLVLEIGAGQGEAVRTLLAEVGWQKVRVLKDYGKNDRCIIAWDPRLEVSPERPDEAAGGERDEAREVAAPVAPARKAAEQDGAVDEPTYVPLVMGEVPARAGAAADPSEPVYVVLTSPERPTDLSTKRVGASAGPLRSSLGAASQPVDRAGASGGRPGQDVEYVALTPSQLEESLLAAYGDGGDEDEASEGAPDAPGPRPSAGPAGGRPTHRAPERSGSRGRTPT